MGLQVASFSAGGGPAVIAAQPDLPPALQEKKPPLPAEIKAASQAEAPLNLPGSARDQAPAEVKAGLKQTASELERISLAFDRRLKFIIDQESREILIKVIDNETDKVIKVLPPEELQRLHSRIRETIGFLFDAMV